MSFLLANVFFFSFSLRCQSTAHMSPQKPLACSSSTVIGPLPPSSLCNAALSPWEEMIASGGRRLRWRCCDISRHQRANQREVGGENIHGFFPFLSFPGQERESQRFYKMFFSWGGGERGVGVVKNGLHSVANGDGESGKPQPTAQRKTPGASSSAEHSDSTAARAASARRSSLSSGVS